MDVVSHALWGGIVFGGGDHLIMAAAFGAAPDLIPFVPFTIHEIISKKRIPEMKPELKVFPAWTFKLYDLTHSVVIYTLIFIVSYILFGKTLAWASLAWLLHILMDIPTHDESFFPTRFLFPLSTFSINGIPWSHKYVMLTNYTALCIAFGLAYWR